MKRTLYNIIILIASLLPVVTVYADTPSGDYYAKLLNWVKEKNLYNICGGYYLESPIVYQKNPLTTSQDNNFNVTANHFTYSLQGTSHFAGNVVVTQPASRLTAQSADLYRDPKTGKMQTIKAYGNVSVYQPGTLLVAPSAIMHLDTKQVIMQNAAYRHAVDEHEAPIKVINPKTGQEEDRRYELSYWGHAKAVEQTKPKFFVFKHATYTTCPPQHASCAWHLHASTVTLNKNTQVGKAYNSVLYVKNVPVFYFPYVSFPLSRERKSGFLAPSYYHSSAYGYEFTLPYYWNIAPNYDATITPAYYTQRGFMISSLFRYLEPNTNGNLNASFLPYDRKFRAFQTSAPLSGLYTSKPQGLSDLEKDSDSRYSFYWLNNTNLNSSWNSNVNFSAVSDDYYILDLGHAVVNNSQNQLLQQANINYQGPHWQFTTLMQGYQTLHPIQMATISNQYERLPEFQLNGTYLDAVEGADFTMRSAATDFYQMRTPDTSTTPVIGDRVALNPALDHQFMTSYGYFTPSLQLQANQYNLQRTAGLPKQPGLALPTFDADTGLYFDRDFNFNDNPYQQTLEPRLFYVYTPYKNQNNLPIFDTTTQGFNYGFLFLTNRFSGVDRVGDANQLTYALTSRIINEYTGTEQGSVSIGDIYYLSTRKVQLCTNPNCTTPSTLDRRSFSPIASQATYNFTPALKSTTAVTWDQYIHSVSNATQGITYNQLHHLFNLNYNYNKISGETMSGLPANTPDVAEQDIDASGEWMLWRHVDLLGRYSYTWSGNTTTNHGNAYLGGIEYDSCCWAVRLIGARSFTGVSINNRNQFQNLVYLQFDLKGLGSIGTDDPSTFLSSSINNYHSSFDPEIL